MAEQEFGGTILKVDADGNLVLSSTLDEEAGERRTVDIAIGRLPVPAGDTPQADRPWGVHAEVVEPNFGDPYIRVTWNKPTGIPEAAEYHIVTEPPAYDITQGGGTEDTKEAQLYAGDLVGSGYGPFAYAVYAFHGNEEWEQTPTSAASPEEVTLPVQEGPDPDVPRNVTVDNTNLPDDPPPEPYLRIFWDAPTETANVIGYQIATVDDEYTYDSMIENGTEFFLFASDFTDPDETAFQWKIRSIKSHSQYSDWSEPSAGGVGVQ